jgi:hypothetical protein
MNNGKVIAWPDRVGLAFSVLLLAASIWLVYYTRTALPGAALSIPWQQAFREQIEDGSSVICEMQLFFALPIWLFLRLVDFVLGGPTRRHESRLDAEFRETAEFRLSNGYGWEEVVHLVWGETSEYFDRLAIPEGWIYKFEIRQGETRNCSITFVPLKPHKRH